MMYMHKFILRFANKSSQRKSVFKCTYYCTEIYVSIKSPFKHATRPFEINSCSKLQYGLPVKLVALEIFIPNKQHNITRRRRRST